MTEETFSEWKQMKETQEVLRYLAKKRDDRLERMVDIGFGAQKIEDVIQFVKLSAYIVGLNELIELEQSDLEFGRE